MPTFTFTTRLPLPESSQALQDRVKALFAIKDELDREIETLMGKRSDLEPGKPWHCVRCDHNWLSRLPHRPRMCPNCKTKRFDSQPTYTYAERAQKKKVVPTPAPLPHSVMTRSLLPTDPMGPVALTPPPTVPLTGMSLRERLALMNAAKQQEPVSSPEPEAITITYSDDELIESINGEPDAT